jgi:hypothetical protein
MPDELTGRVHQATATSELVGAIFSVRQDGGRAYALGDAALRPLTVQEIAQLEQLGNFCLDWTRIRVADGFDVNRIRNSTFQGEVLLGRFAGQNYLAQNLPFPTGIYNATLADCVIGHDVLLREVKLLARYVVAERALLHNCGIVVCEGQTAFGNGAAIPVGIESGGRDVPVYAEIDVATAAEVASRRSRRGMLSAFTQAVAEYTEQVTSNRGVVARGAVLQNTPTIRDTYIGPYARIDGATLVGNSTVLSSPDQATRIESGAAVTDSLLQWGSHVATMAVVERSVLAEHAHAAEHGKVIASLVGPNSGVAKGEVTSCLLGPFVSFHHQALLIATLWPEGKGNVSYGANVGANHTSKAPDQEFWPGEGTFLGLGVNIKFPSDFSRAPYTIVAAGVTTLPQKLEFPFSLINVPSAQHLDIPPAYNEVMPAWLLTDNLFTLKRNEGKFRARNKARRQQFEFAIFRPEIVDLMRMACQRLETVSLVKQVYTERDIEGLGKNYLLEYTRQAAIDAYRFFVRYYAHLRLKERVQTLLEAKQTDAVDSVLITSAAEPIWEHARKLLSDDLGIRTVAAGLRELPGILERIAREVERSKAKDDERGLRIIDDYADVHTPAARDPFVQQTWEETRCLQREVEELLACLSERRPGRSGIRRSPWEAKQRTSSREAG